jgi:DNA-binding NtrC family response regulator
MQSGLLRVLQEKVVRPVGGSKEQPVDVRLIAATNRDLGRMVENETFRTDLYYRLHVVEVRLPPLRERLEDLPVLLDHFLQIFAARFRRDKKTISREAVRKLSGYGWPGNVRQLENVLLNAWVMSDRPELSPDDFDLPVPLRRTAPGAEAPSSPRTASAPGPGSRPGSSKKPQVSSRRQKTQELKTHRDAEKERIIDALQACNWNRVRAARMVGMPRRTFYRRLKEYGIQ